MHPTLPSSTPQLVDVSAIARTSEPAQTILGEADPETTCPHMPNARIVQGLALASPVTPFNETLPTDAELASAIDPKIIDQFMEALEASVRRRVLFRSFPADGGAEAVSPSVAILFSGGIDSMMLAAICDRVMDPALSIDLLNVAFDNERRMAVGAAKYDVPDRLTGRAGLKELQQLSDRKWNFVEVNVTTEELQQHRNHIRDLIFPLDSVLDDSIGCAIWFAARGYGSLLCEPVATVQDISNPVITHAEADAGSHSKSLPDDHQAADSVAVSESNAMGQVKQLYYRSQAKILLVGMGADEQLGGYSRHRTAYQAASWSGLAQEMKLDIERISHRNLGRDDRCISDHGKEARFPFLDEDLVSLLNAPSPHQGRHEASARPR
eukprot:m.700266 g.700266  ORF g.700266 m.700266 type:complete len:381 (-) comp58702_c0_seq8:193-1335(-)